VLLGYRVGLHLQQREGGFGLVVVLVDTGSHLFVACIEEPTPVGALFDFEDHETTSVVGQPNHDRAKCRLAVGGVETDLGIRERSSR
jgi:hypothetical protein